MGVNASSTFGRRAPPLAPPRAIWLENCQSPLSGKDDGWQVVTDPVAGDAWGSSLIEMVFKTLPILSARSTKEHIVGIQRFGP